jgi:1-acyl-sn-glycerol-3-phosphate acyltransferase
MMENEVKTCPPLAGRSVARTGSSKSPGGSISWLLYFIFTIGFLGSFTAYAFTIPLGLLSHLYPPLRTAGGKVLAFGVRLLFACQPWLNLKVEINLPSKNSGVLTISNHRSHLDMFILLAQICNVRAVTKKSLFNIPLLGIMLRVQKMIPIRRGNVASYCRAMDLAEKGLRRKDVVHIFPEMTRCPEGFRGTQDFHLAPFRMAQRANVPLVPIVFIDTDRAWSKGHAGLRFRTPLLVKSLKAIDPGRFATAADLRRHVKRAIDLELALHGS